MIKKPTKDTLNNIDLSNLEPLLAKQRIGDGYFRRDAGTEHYKLLAWLSSQFNNVVITEIGTLDGMGLVALSYNPNNKIVSWDIKDCSWKGEVPKNGERKIVYNGYIDEVLKSPVIFYDGAHEGKDEKEFLDELLKREWHGVVIWDDIHLNKEMREFWQKCIDDGYNIEDWTDVGHNTGTGVMFL